VKHLHLSNREQYNVKAATPKGNETVTYPTASLYATKGKIKHVTMTSSSIKDEARSPNGSHVRLQRSSKLALMCSRWKARKLIDKAKKPSTRITSNQAMPRRVRIVSCVKCGSRQRR
jgi:hypothetical protein